MKTGPRIILDNESIANQPIQGEPYSNTYAPRNLVVTLVDGAAHFSIQGTGVYLPLDKAVELREWLTEHIIAQSSYAIVP